MSNPKLSVIITAKDKNDPKLKDLLYSIEQQTFKDYEVIIVTEGDSESAKAIGIKKAKGEIVCILASDNYLTDINFFQSCLVPFQYQETYASYPLYYSHKFQDNILNRYFSLFGVNDPIPLYLGKNDKLSWYIETYQTLQKEIPLTFKTYGDNGFFIRKDIILKSDMEHYYHIDNISDIIDGYGVFGMLNTSIWHRTGGNIFKFFVKRYRYADKFATPYRRWHMVEKKDIPRLLWFIFCTITLIQPLCLSFKGYRVIKDKAWFLHPIVCWFTLITYGLWTLKRLTESILTHVSNS